MKDDLIKEVMRELGSRRSARKTDTARENGKLGGRPRKSLDAVSTVQLGSGVTRGKATVSRSIEEPRKKSATVRETTYVPFDDL